MCFVQPTTDVNFCYSCAGSFLKLLTKRSAQPQTAGGGQPVLIQTVSDETAPISGADLIPQKRRKTDTMPPPSRGQKPVLCSDKGKTPFAPPEVLADKVPPQDHIIVASTRVWGDNVPLTDLLRELQNANETVTPNLSLVVHISYSYLHMYYYLLNSITSHRD